MMPGLPGNAMLNILVAEPVVTGSAASLRHSYARRIVLSPLAALRGEGMTPAGAGAD